jgi:glutathione S-transferase
MVPYCNFDLDPEGGGKPISIFESGAILIYLAEKVGRFFPKDLRTRVEVMQWLFWQVGGLGPMVGQQVFFRRGASEQIPLAIDRLTNETARLDGVMNKHLADRPFLAGDEYTIADISAYPWVAPYTLLSQAIDNFSHVERWLDTIAARPATQRAQRRLPPTHAEVRSLSQGLADAPPGPVTRPPEWVQLLASARSLDELRGDREEQRVGGDRKQPRAGISRQAHQDTRREHLCRVAVGCFPKPTSSS